MKKIRYTILFLILAFLISILPDISSFKGSLFNFIGNIFYIYDKSDDSLLFYQNSIINSKNNEIATYNVGNLFYKKGDYESAILEYKKINSTGSELGFNVLHNIGNTYYRLGEKNGNKEKKILLWSNSINSYKNASDLKIDIDKTKTYKNYLFVLDKLKKILDPDKKQDNKSGSGQQNNNTNTGSGKIWTNSSQGFTNFGNNENKQLSVDEKKELNKYSEYLKEFQKQNQNYIQNTSNNTDSFDDLINRFFRGDPNFDNILSDNSNGGKDW